MSDDENEDNQPQPMFIPMMQPPTKEQIDQMNMQHSATAHETIQFFEALNEEQLRKLHGVMQACIQTEGNSAIYYTGLIHGMLNKNFKVCIACGEKHDEQLAAMHQADKTVDVKSKPDDPSADPAILEAYAIEIDEYARVVCTYCKTEFASVEDRMLGKPGKGGCPTCVEKEKWG